MVAKVHKEINYFCKSTFNFEILGEKTWEKSQN